MYFEFCEQLLEDLLFNMLDSPYYHSKDCSSSSSFPYNYSKGEESSSFSPKVNMYEDEKKYFIHVDLPGMTRDQVKMEINEEGRVLTITGERVYTEDRVHNNNATEGDSQTEKNNNESNENNIPKETSSNKKYSLKECSYGKFNRSITLPEKANLDNIQANMENGLLEITIDKIDPPKIQKRTIEIQ